MRQILHVIPGLNTGDAEMMLYRLLSRLDPQEFSFTVISLTTLGLVGEKIKALGVPVRALGMKPGVSAAFQILPLARFIGKYDPALVHSWLYHANLATTLALLMGSARSHLWAIHQRHLSPDLNKRSTLAVARLCAVLSRWQAARVLYNSISGFQAHKRFGYRGPAVIIPDGFDANVFRPDAAKRAMMRKAWGVRESDVLIGMASPFDPRGDHENFIQAAGKLAIRHAHVRFVLMGTGMDENNPVLMDLIKRSETSDRFFLLGERQDRADVLVALDIGTLSSREESCPSAVAETLSCGVPFVGTDVGDTAVLIGDTGRVVTSGNPTALAQTWDELVTQGAEERHRLGRMARERIQTKFEIDQIASRYRDLYRELINHAPRAQRKT